MNDSRNVLRGMVQGMAAGLALAAWLLPCRGFGQTPDAARELELRYVDGLNRLRLPDYAEIVLNRLGTGPEIKTRRLQSSLARGEFDVVKAIIDAEPDQDSLDTWAMRVTLADGYFAWGRYEEAKAIYTKFFDKYAGAPPAGIKSFYLESAYKYAQMLLLLNDPEAAIVNFKRALQADPPRHVKRQIQGDMAELMLKQAQTATGKKRTDYLKEADTIATELLWIQDIWFGKAIVLKAHVMLLSGKVNDAMKLIEDYKEPLIEIDRSLAEESTAEEDLTRLSPMAQARFLVGVILQEEAQRLIAAGGDRAKATELLAGKELPVLGRKPKQLPGAVQHFLNVFVRYANTPWAIEAGERFDQVKTMLEGLGRRVKVEVKPEQWTNVQESQLKNARAVFNQQQWDEAADLYLAILNRFPETSHTVPALGDLATCYIETENDLHADVIIHYLAERFSKRPRSATAAGNLVLNIAKMYGDRDREARREHVYEVYFDQFRTHPLAARLLYSFGERRLAADDIAGALGYYERIVEDHQRSPVVYDALNRIAICHGRIGDKAEEIKALRAYVARMQQDARLEHGLIRGLYRLGTAFRQIGPRYYPAAVQQFSEIVKRLEGKPDGYQTSREQREKNQELLEAAIYYKAYCYAKAEPSKEDEADQFKEVALRTFVELADKFPNSKLTPAALSQVGTLWTILGNAGEAQRAFARLQENYPDSKEARNATFLLGMSLLEMDQRPEAVAVFKQMFGDGGGQFSGAQVLTAARELFDAGEYAIAIEGFDRVLATEQDRALVEPALAGRGRALVALEQYGEGAAALDELFARFPQTSLTVEAALDLSRAYAELARNEPDGDKRFDLFNASINAMKKDRQHDQSPARRAESNLGVGRIVELKAAAERQHGSQARAADYRDEAIASYQTLILFESPREIGVKPFLEEAYYRCLQLFLEKESWQDLFDDASRYLELFERGQYALEVQNMRSRARARLAGAGQLPSDREATERLEELPAAAAPVAAADAQEDDAPVTAAGAQESE